MKQKKLKKLRRPKMVAIQLAMQLAMLLLEMLLVMPLPALLPALLPMTLPALLLVKLRWMYLKELQLLRSCE